MKKYRIGVIGFGQMHITSMVDSFLKMPETFEFMGYADTVTDLVPISTQDFTHPHVRSVIEQKCVGARPYDTITDLLNDKPDLVIVASETSFHCEIICDALNRGIHVIVEKPLSMTYSEAAQMAYAAKKSGAVFMTNWPTAWFRHFRLIGELGFSGIIGDLQRFTYTNAESLGPFSYGQSLTDEEKLHEWWYQRRYGGGAVMDYIGYGCNMSRWMLGEKATAAFCMATNASSPFADIEDHATVVLKFPHARALVEGTWATFAAGNVPSGPILYGDKGTLVTDRYGSTVSLFTERHQHAPTKIYEADPLPEGRSNLAEEFLYALKTGGDMHPILSPEINLDAMAAADAAFRSCDSGKLEIVK